MLVSTKGRYALRTMADLAVHGNGEPVKIKDIAKRQGISGKYLEQIISILSRAGLVRSIRGNQGGYYLAKAPKEYTLGMILPVPGSTAASPCGSGTSWTTRFPGLWTAIPWKTWQGGRWNWKRGTSCLKMGDSDRENAFWGCFL